ncbi:MAG: hypothetical protein H7Z43_06065 [Clostridia bacterium]|nr:hypothetical protein [Deltaproteobacteria bacterium]
MTKPQVAARNACPVHNGFDSIDEFKEFLEDCGFDKTLTDQIVGALHNAAKVGGHPGQIVGRDIRATDFFDKLSTFFFRNGFDSERFEDAMKKIAPDGIGSHQIASLVRALKAEQPDANFGDDMRTIIEYAAFRYFSVGSGKLPVEALRKLYTGDTITDRFTKHFLNPKIKKTWSGVIGSVGEAFGYYTLQQAVYAAGRGYPPETLLKAAEVGASNALGGAGQCPFGHGPTRDSTPKPDSEAA